MIAITSVTGNPNRVTELVKKKKKIRKQEASTDQIKKDQYGFAVSVLLCSAK